MKLTELLIVTAWCSIIAARSEIMDVDQEALLKRAADQLDRLTPYRKAAEDRAEDNLAKLLETWKSVADQNHLDGTKNDADQNIPWEVLEILPEQSDSSEATKRADDEDMITIGIITDPQYADMMRERIKRGFTPGSGSLLTSIAGGVLSGVASASSSSAGKASVGSSSSDYKPSYGASSSVDTYTYGEKPFGPWEFKKAIFGTLFQALKAIGGGVLALKGQLVKGSGYLLAAKSKVFGRTGDAITSFGKHLAASVLTEPKPYPPETYYDHPPSIQNIEHGYQGPPPSSDDYSEANEYSPHETYGAPSDDNDQGGLLIVTPTKSDPDEHSDQHVDVVVPEKPNLATLEESFGGPTKGTIITNLFNIIPKGIAQASISGTKDQPIANQDHNNLDAIQHPAPVVGALNHYTALNHDNPIENYEQSYHADQDAFQHQPQLPPETALPHHHQFPNLDDPKLTIQPSVEYPPLQLQQIQYASPHGALLNSFKLPSHDDGGTSVYSSLSLDTEPQIGPLKVPLPVPNSDALDLPKLQTHVDFHGQPHFGNLMHGNLGGPLKIPLLSSKPAGYYWQTQGSFMPTSTFNTFDQFQKRNALRRRMFAKRLARHSSLQRLYRL